MATLAELTKIQTDLFAARMSAARRVQNENGEKIENRTDTEMPCALATLDAEIAGPQTRSCSKSRQENEMKNYVQKDENISVTAAADVNSGDIVKVGYTIGIAAGAQPSVTIWALLPRAYSNFPRAAPTRLRWTIPPISNRLTAL